MRKRTILAVCLAACLCNAAALAEVLVDTGPGSTSSIGSQSLFNDGPGSFQFLAGRFTLTEGATLESVEAWMKPFGTGGDLTVLIYTDGPTPGTPIFSKTYTIGDRFAAGWDLFADYDVVLPAGSYWVAFEPVAGSGVQHGMPTGAPSPLDTYAFSAAGNPGWIAYGTSLGVRISGTTTVDVPFGTATRLLADLPFGHDRDEIKGGAGEVETLRYYWTNFGLSIARGTISDPGLTVGAYADQGQDNQFASRAVAFRTYTNSSANPMEFKASATLGGEFRPAPFSLPNGYLSVTAGIYLLDPQLFQDTVATSGLPVEEFLLSGNSLIFPGSGSLREALDTLFPVAARLGRDTVTDLAPVFDVPLSYPLETPLVTIGAGESFTLMFDVAAIGAGSGGGEVDFLSTLEPDPDLFTDSGDNPITVFQPLGTGISIGEASGLTWQPGAGDTLFWTSASGSTLSRLYRGTPADLPALVDATPDACLQLETSSNESGPVLTGNPSPPGDFYWYLIVGTDGAAEGQSGPGVSGARSLDPTGSCP